LLAGWDGTEPERIRRLLEQGVPAVWYPAMSLPLARLQSALTNAAPEGAVDAQAAWEEKSEGWRLAVAAPDHPVFRAFATGEYGDPARGIVRGRLALKTAQLPDGETLLAYADGTPALWLARGSLPLALWNIPLDQGLSSVQNQGEFVPLLGELLLALRRGSPTAVRAAREHVPGERLAWQPGLEIRAAEIRMEGPDGTAVPVDRIETSGGTLMSGRLERLGVYAWFEGERVIGREVVNFPAAESDLRLLPGSEIKQLGAVTASSGRDVREWQAGIPVWQTLVGVALALLLCEGAVAASDSFKRQRKERAKIGAPGAESA
jgi:hypothetical protein